MKSERIALWDNVKFLLIITVVIGHFIDSFSKDSGLYRAIFLFIYSFHMPLFLFVSGLFHKNEHILEKILSYLSIYFLTKIVFFFIRIGFGKSPSFSVFNEGGLPWFMLAMAVFIGLTYLFRNLNTLFVLIFFLILACFSGYDKNIGEFFAVSRLIVFYPFYLLGTMIPRQKLESLAQKKWIKVSSIIILFLWAVICLVFIDKIYGLRYIFTARNPFRDAVRPYGFLYRLFGYAVSLIMGLAFIFSSPYSYQKTLTPFGARTLQIYFWHCYIRNIFVYSGIGEKIFAFYPIGRILWMILPIGVAYLFAAKLFSFPTDYLLKAPFKKEK